MTKLPIGVDINHLIDDLRIFSWEAKDIFLHYFQVVKDKKNIMSNEDINDPVTHADIKVNKLIIRRINEKYKNVSWDILSEENVKLISQKRKFNAEWLWVFDPLDGTRDFVQGSENYAMHLALNHKNKPLLGVVLIPSKGELWITDGKETWYELSDGMKRNFTKSKKKSFKELTLVTSKNHKNLVLNSLVEQIKFKKVISMGSIGCKIVSILKGESDVYISLSMPGQNCPKDWDFAAPEAILRASGGSITDLNNQDIKYNQTNYEQGGIIVASSNQVNHKKLCNYLKDIIRVNDLYPLDYF